MFRSYISDFNYVRILSILAFCTNAKKKEKKNLVVCANAYGRLSNLHKNTFALRLLAQLFLFPS